MEYTHENYVDFVNECIEEEKGKDLWATIHLQSGKEITLFLFPALCLKEWIVGESVVFQLPACVRSQDIKSLTCFVM